MDAEFLRNHNVCSSKNRQHTKDTLRLSDHSRDASHQNPTVSYPLLSATRSTRSRLFY